jgi:DNA topoisomerase-3
MTARWERDLRRIERGEADAAEFLADIVRVTRRMVAEVAGQQERHLPPEPRGAAGRTPGQRPQQGLGPCPRCGQGQIVEGRKGFGCTRWRPEDGGCRWVLWAEVAGKRLTAAQARELLERGETRREISGFRSKAGKEFAARLRLDRDTGRVTFVFDPPAGSRGA